MLFFASASLGNLQQIQYYHGWSHTTECIIIKTKTKKYKRNSNKQKRKQKKN